jgi:hypothetical protein
LLVSCSKQIRRNVIPEHCRTQAAPTTGCRNCSSFLHSLLVALFLISRRARLRMGTERNIVARQRRVARGGSGAVAPCSTGAAAKPELRTRSVTDRHRRSGRTKCARRVSAGGANRSHRLRRTVRLSLSLSGEARECSFYLGDWLRVKDVSDANHRTSLRPMSVARNWTASII